MKKSINILAGICLSLSLAGCNDFLDRTPYDKIGSDSAFATEFLAESVVTGAYGNLLYDYITTGNSVLNWDAFSSVMDPTSTAVTLAYPYLQGTILASHSSFSTYWSRFYEGVYRANDVINNIHTCPQMSDQLKSRRIAECKFLRAYHYYRLNCLWRGVPIYLENLSNEQYTRPRSSEEQVWQTIIADLTDCINCDDLPGKYPKGSADYGRITKGAAYTLRGKVYLWLKEYQKAENDFLAVGNLGYDLFKGSYADLFKEENEQCDEMIFSVQMIEAPSAGNQFSYVYGNMATAGKGNSSFFLNTNFVDSYEWADGRPFDWDEVLAGYSALDSRARSAYFLRDNMTEAEKTAMSAYGADMNLYLSVGNEARIQSAYTGRDPRLAATAITPYSTYMGVSGSDEADFVMRWPIRTSSADDLTGRNDAQHMLYMIRKFVAEGKKYTNINYNPVDVPVFRYADVLLSLAEAVNGQGRFSDAAEYVNRVRSRAGVALLNSSDATTVRNADEMALRIRNEKKWELACEEQLYYEELRWGTWQSDKFAAGNGMLEVWGTPVYEYQWGGSAYLKWAVPSSECERSGLEQNEGWY